jgi:hypothetical protein
VEARERSGHWQLTFSGKQFFPLDPRPEDVCLEDIAHALANLCRFCGQCRKFYSVAQHSILVAMQLPPELQLQGLLHDAPEAYCGDIIQPLKVQLPQFKAIEHGIWRAIAAKFKLPEVMDARVKAADLRALMTERRDLMPASPHVWSTEHIQPLPGKVMPWGPDEARQAFNTYFLALTQPKILAADGCLAAVPPKINGEH